MTKITASHLARVIRHRGHGHHWLVECGFCGTMEWSMTDGSKPDGVTITESDNINRCSQCSYMRTRHPEVSGWVMDCLGKAIVAERERIVANLRKLGTATDLIIANAIEGDGT